MFHRQLSRLIVGLFIIGVGLVALLDNARLLDGSELRPYWPLVLVALGVVRLFSWRSAIFSSALILIGLVLTAQNLGYVTLHWRDWWPVLAIVWGASFLLHGGRWREERWKRRQMRRAARWQRRTGMPPVLGPGGNTVIDNSDHVIASATLSNTVMSNASQDFRGGDLNAVLGGIELDLRDAAIRSEAVLLVKVVMGGIEIKVPRTWAITVRAEHVMAGVDDRSTPPVTPSGRLIIDGEIVMGGVTIRN